MKKLQLAEVHESLGAKMTPFAGWEMPIKYSRIADEHMAVRKGVGLFDISHMGEILVEGSTSIDFLQRVTSNNVSSLDQGDAQYSTVLNESGGVKDDVFVYCLSEEEYMIVVNAANTTKILEWFEQNSLKDTQIKNVTESTVMLALQGPKSQGVLQRLTDYDLEDLKQFTSEKMNVLDHEVLVSRSGYTGEDGFEIYIFNQSEDPIQGKEIWSELLRVGDEENIKPCGLGARDSLRLEAGFPLYGHELSEEISPLEARISFTVDFEKEDFIGRDALKKQKEEGLTHYRIGLEMKDAGVPREGYSLIHDDEEIGEVTSGGYSPVLKKGIAMGYSRYKLSEGEEIMIEIRDEEKRAEIVSWPFHKE